MTKDDPFQDPVELSALFTAHLGASTEFETITKDSEGFGYNYADLGQVRRMTAPVLAKWGLTILQFPTTGNAPGTVGVRTILAHSSGERLEETCSIRVSEHKSMSFEQCAGTAITYLRRYAWLGVCGLAPEDNDAAKPRPNNSKPQGKGGSNGW